MASGPCGIRRNVMTMKTFVAFCALMVAATFVAAPLAAADTTVCVSVVCQHTSTKSSVQTWTCGGSGNIIIQNGENNTANVCQGGNNNTGSS